MSMCMCGDRRGTVGDIESLPFWKAIRQMGVELGRDHCVTCT